MGQHVLLLCGMVFGVFLTCISCQDPEQPKKEMVFETEGGNLEVWSQSFKPLEDAKVSAGILTLERGGLHLPHYLDSPLLLYVLQGCARVGLHYPTGWPGTTVRKVTRGDVLVLPQGWVRWMYNHGEEKFRAFGMVKASAGPDPRAWRPFYLMGGGSPRFGGLLLGFSNLVLARVWDIPENMVHPLLGSQKGSVIVKVDQSQLSGWDEEEDMYSDGGVFPADFRINIDEAEPTVYANGGGSLTVLFEDQLPILKKVDMMVIRGRLWPGAKIAPHWTLNASAVVYVTWGKGRVQIVGPDGNRMRDLEVHDGDFFFLPRFLPIVMVAHQSSPLGYIMIGTSSRLEETFFEGRNNIFRFIPRQVRRAAFNISQDLDAKLFQKAAGRNAVILPRHIDSRGSTHPDARGGGHP